ncbi:GumC domain-containing protein [Anaerosacchariphilus polymeriproducens]|uniref:Uncharacterized protein n=1 Tax=Anaerosacchariphilus polymeriproducens TaxID=1812858 RepID=A0A371AZ63_9FIRM|nr:hypothetical protein [Anaerosacchariphilus polymeriproducens]RDU24792.1 hypothetical protein DWV06_02110 [Anaerosacchariphilus polymeriproducens]
MMYYIRLFIRTLYISAGVAAIVAMSYGVYNLAFGHQEYKSTASILINEDVNSPYIEWAKKESYAQNGNGAVTDVNFVTNLVNATVRYISSNEYQKAAIEKLKGKVPNIEKYNFGNVKTNTFTGSSIVTVTASYEDNKEYPALIANALCESYKEISAKRFNADYCILFAKAVPSTVPENMPITTGMILSGAGSLILTFALILVVDTLARSEGNELSWKLFGRKGSNTRNRR